MVAFSFMKRFVADVEAGRKLQTMRKGALRCKVGDRVQLYYGQRTKHCRKLAESVCKIALPVRLSPYFITVFDWTFPESERDIIARMDGFKNWEELVEFFFPFGWCGNSDDFIGGLYQWAPLDVQQIELSIKVE